MPIDRYFCLNILMNCLSRLLDTAEDSLDIIIDSTDAPLFIRAIVRKFINPEEDWLEIFKV